MISFFKFIFASLLASSLLWGCAATQDPSKWSAERFFSEAKEALDSSDYQTAIKYFEDLDIYHPFSPYTQQAQLEVAYTYYKYGEPDSSIAAAERYIKLYPRSENVDYAYYLRGLVAFERGTSGIDLAFNLDTSNRQPNSALNAYSHFKELTERFPNSQYVDDAKQRIVDLRNKLAEYELHVARYYLRRGANLSAAQRAKYTLETYPQTPAIPDALALLTEAYTKLGVDDLANNTLKVLRLNYPDHVAIKKLAAALDT